MPGMSPRIKAKKGRFGVAGLLPPTVSITSPAEGATISTTATFVGVASDDLNGNVSSDIVWTSDVDGALGTGASVTINSPALTVGAHVITASITSGGETATDVVNVTVA